MLTAALLACATAAQANTPVPEPAVQGPIAAEGVHALPFNGHATLLDLSAAGYVQQEYFMSGTATSIGSALPVGPAVAGPRESAPYRTRLLVRRPSDPQRFNGTVLVEWFNVTGGQDLDIVWIWSHPELMREGYAYVAVSAQTVGVTALRSFLDPVRYQTLSHPGDEFSMDIFSQALMALRQREGADPLGGLNPERILATGESQSAIRLHDYIDLGVQREAGLADGILLDAGGETDFTRAQPDVPVMHFRGEEQAIPGPRSQSPNYRVWSVAGAPHVDAWALRFYETFLPAYLLDDRAARFDPVSAGAYGERGGSAPPACTQQSPDSFPVRYAMDAAIHALDRWVRTGVAPAGSPEFEYKPRAASHPAVQGYTIDGAVLRDEYGNIRGGLRLPPIAVPLAEYNGNACGLVGYSVPFDDAKLRRLYPTFGDYYAKLSVAVRTSVEEEHLRPADARDLLARACAAAFRWPSTFAPACDDDAARACIALSGGAAGRRLGIARLGRSRRAQRRVLAADPIRSGHSVDSYCLRGGGMLRIGYARRHAVFLATTGPRAGLGAIRVGAPYRPRGRARRIRVGGATWWLSSHAGATGLIKVRGGRVIAVGLADARLARTPAAARRMVRTFG